MTVQLECFVLGVHFNRAFKLSSVYKFLGIMIFMP